MQTIALACSFKLIAGNATSLSQSHCGRALRLIGNEAIQRASKGVVLKRVRKANLHAKITIRPFADGDASQVRELFIATNRLLSPPDLRDAFEAYIERSLAEEIDRIAAYYREHDGGFWVARSEAIGSSAHLDGRGYNWQNARVSSALVEACSQNA
jgi:hypothetical protein